MADVLLALGPIYFQGFELPPEIDFGGQQRLAIHRLTDGRRVIDCLGRDDSNIQFSGVLTGPNANSRAQALDALRGSGLIVPLTWDVFFYSVLVTEFSATYCNPGWIPYTLTCTVLRDEAASVADLVPELVELLTGDISAASSVLTGTSIDFSGLKSALIVPDACTYGSAAFQSTRDMLQLTSVDLQAQKAEAELEFAAINPPEGPLLSAIAKLPAATEAARQIATVSWALGFVGEANMRLAAGA